MFLSLTLSVSSFPPLYITDLCLSVSECSLYHCTGLACLAAIFQTLARSSASWLQTGEKLKEKWGINDMVTINVKVLLYT